MKEDNPFQCPKCGREKDWEEAPICDVCGQDETKEVKNG